MGCQSEVIIGNNLTFSICTHDPNTGELSDADSNPTYRIYEEETAAPILTGTMATLDALNTVGFYTKKIACTEANGFESGKSYSIYIEAAVNGATGGIPYSFSALSESAAAGGGATGSGAVPSPPYCSTYDVAWLVPNLTHYQDFSASTAPSYYAVRKLIDWYSTWVETEFARVGYYVPWQELDDESWPTHQTSLLLLIVALGVAGAISGPVVKPAPSQGTRRGSTDNVYTQEYKEFIEKIQKDGLGFRADHRVGSDAEQFVRSPMGPLTDHILGIVDPTRWQLTTEYTAMIQGKRKDYGICSAAQPWDHLATRLNTLVGL